MTADHLDPTTLRALAKRVEAGEGGREVDSEIMSLFGWCLHLHKEWGGAQNDRGFSCPDCGADSWGNRSTNGWDQRLYDHAPPLTTSLDAVEALRVRLLPSNPPCIIWDDGLCTAVQGQRWEGDAVFPIDATSSTEIAARLAALLYALAVKVEKWRIDNDDN